MKTGVHLIASALYLSTGLVSLVMAGKNLSAKKFLPFQEKAAGLAWDAVDPRLRPVILSLTNVAGLGFLIVGLLLTASAFIIVVNPHRCLEYGVPSAALLFCLGLFGVNFRLHRQTGTATPWKGSLIAAGLVATGMIMLRFA